MNPIRTTVSCFLLLVLFANSRSGPLALAGESRSLTRDGAIQLAYQNNRELGIAALEIRRAASRLEWSGRLDNPELEASASGDGIGRDEGESNYEVAFTQAFPLTAKLRHEKTVRRHQVILAEAEIAERRRQLAGKVDLAIVDLLATREGIRLQRQLIGLNKEMVAFMDEQAKQGEVSRLDVVQATLNGRTLEQSLHSLEAHENQHRLALNQLIGLEPDTAIHLTESIDLPESEAVDISLDRVLQQRPDYVLALAKIDEANAAVILEEANRWGDLSVKFFVEGEKSVDAPNGLERNTFAGVGFSLPLPLRKRNQDGIAQAQLDREAADKEVSAARFKIRSECEEAYQARSGAWDLARDASGEILQLAQDNLEGFRTAYEQGQSSLIPVQRAQEQLLELRTAAIDFAADYHRASARLRLATGNYPGLSISHSSK